MAAVDVDLNLLRQFHAAHFLRQPVPNLKTACASSQTTSSDETHVEDCDHDLGYYVDGVKRALTDEQIAMFRHSEIQRLLQERRREAEVALDEQERPEGRLKHPVKSKTKIHNDPRGDVEGLQARGKSAAGNVLKSGNANIGGQKRKLVQYAEDE